MNILVLAALTQELGDAFKDVPYVFFTGVGKVNAAHAAATMAQANDLDLVVNFGTVASHDSRPGQIYSCTQFCQTDIDCRPLGVDRGVTPFETIPYRLEIPNRVPWLPKARCLTQDKFVDAPYEPEKGIVEVYDMEAYAIAKVCFLEKIPFACVKYVTDSGNPKDWESNCGKAAVQFREIYDRLMDRCQISPTP